MARSSKKRQDILNAAIQAFKSKGFESTSMDQIAIDAQVSKRTVYNHFASKELLFDGIVEQLMAMFKTAVMVSYDSEKSLESQLRQIAEQEILALSSNEFTDLAKVCMAEAIHNPQRINQAIAQVEKRDGDLHTWLTKAVADDRLAIEDIEFAATQFYGLIKSFCFWPQNIQGMPFPDLQQQKQIVESAVNMFIGHYTKL